MTDEPPDRGPSVSGEMRKPPHREDRVTERPLHRCHQFTRELVWEAWQERGALRERIARTVPLCRECGAPRPKRAPRKRVRVQVEAVHPEEGALSTETARRVTAMLARRGHHGGPVRAKGLLSSLAGAGLSGSVVEAELDRLLRRGLVRLTYRLRGERREIDSIELSDPGAVEETAHPGRRNARDRAVEGARGRLARLRHPVAAEVERILAGPDLGRLTPLHVEALAAVAEHADAGDVLPRRVFSARHLGNSKALARVSGLLQSLLGPLDRLGIREGDALTLVGGPGVLRLRPMRGRPPAGPPGAAAGSPGAKALDLTLFPPYLGLSRETLARLERVDAPGGALLVVENLAVFEACCRGEVTDLAGATVVWSAGYPGRGVRALVEAAGRSGARIDVWADLDLDGVRIARLVAQWSEGARPVRMSPADLTAAAATRRLEPRARRALEADLAVGPDAPLAETLQAILEAGRWAEQEVFLGGTGAAPEETDRGGPASGLPT